MKNLPVHPQAATTNIKNSPHNHNHNQTNPKPQPKPETKAKTQPSSRLVHTKHPQPQLNKKQTPKKQPEKHLHTQNKPTTTKKKNSEKALWTSTLIKFKIKIRKNWRLGKIHHLLEKRIGFYLAAKNQLFSLLSLCSSSQFLDLANVFPANVIFRAPS